MKAKGVTPAQALAAGVSVDIDSVPAVLKATLAAQLAAAGPNPDPMKIAALNDPAVLEALVEANAVIGLSARNIAMPLNGKIDINPDNVFAGESVGVTCAFCHSITDGSVLSMAGGGTIGKRVDGAFEPQLAGRYGHLARHQFARLVHDAHPRSRQQSARLGVTQRA